MLEHESKQTGDFDYASVPLLENQISLFFLGIEASIPVELFLMRLSNVPELDRPQDKDNNPEQQPSIDATFFDRYGEILSSMTVTLNTFATDLYATYEHDFLGYELSGTLYTCRDSLLNAILSSNQDVANIHLRFEDNNNCGGCGYEPCCAEPEEEPCCCEIDDADED
jgi:hypothetical protein